MLIHLKIKCGANSEIEDYGRVRSTIRCKNHHVEMELIRVKKKVQDIWQVKKIKKSLVVNQYSEGTKKPEQIILVSATRKWS